MIPVKTLFTPSSCAASQNHGGPRRARHGGGLPGRPRRLRRRPAALRAATLIDASLALVPASCLLAAPNVTLSTTQQEACLRGECGDALARRRRSCCSAASTGGRRRSSAASSAWRRASPRGGRWATRARRRCAARAGTSRCSRWTRAASTARCRACRPPRSRCTRAAIGDEVHVVGFGHAPNFDDRAEWHLRLAPDGGARPPRRGGTRRQRAQPPGRRARAGAGPRDPALRRRPRRRRARPPAAAAAAGRGSTSDAAVDATGDGCARRVARAHRRGGRGALGVRGGVARPLVVDARVAVLGGGGAAKLGPPAARGGVRRRVRRPRSVPAREIAPLAAGAAVAAATAADPACATVDCGAHGSCIDGACACRPAYHGPRCTVSGLPRTPSPRANIAVSPDGADVEGCGSARAPCRTPAAR